MLTDEQWTVSEPLVEACRRKEKTPAENLRRTVTAIMWRHDAASASEVSNMQPAFNARMTPAAVAVGVIESSAAAVQLAPKIEAGFHVA